jgi:hypothetical protein
VRLDRQPSRTKQERPIGRRMRIRNEKDVNMSEMTCIVLEDYEIVLDGITNIVRCPRTGERQDDVIKY